MIQRMMAGGFLIIVGMILATTNIGVTLDQFTSFEDEYPVNGDWSNNGTLTELEQDNQDRLTVTEATGEGTFESFNIQKGGQLQFERILTDVEAGGADDEVILTVEALTESGSVIQSESKDLTEDSEFIPVEGLNNDSLDRVRSYRFEYSLATDYTGVDPHVESLTVAGRYDMAADDSIVSNLNQVLGLLFVGLGLVMILSIFFGRDW